MVRAQIIGSLGQSQSATELYHPLQLGVTTSRWKRTGGKLQAQLHSKIKEFNPNPNSRGLSHVVSDQNLHFQRLEGQIEARLAREVSGTPDDSGRHASAAPDMQFRRAEFEKEMQVLSREIEEAWTQARGGPRMGTQAPEESSPVSKSGLQDTMVEQALKRRLRRFRKVRKIEPPPPPLPSLKDIPRHPPAPNDIVVKQASWQYLKNYQPGARETHIKETMAQNHARRLDVKHRHVHIKATKEEEARAAYVANVEQREAWLQKFRAIQDAKMSRAHLVKKGMASDAGWLVVAVHTIAMMGWAKTLTDGKQRKGRRTAIKQRMSVAVMRMNFMRVLTQASLKDESQPEKEAERIRGDPAALAKVVGMQRKVKERFTVRRKRESAEAVLELLRAWRRDGSFFVVCARFFRQVKRVQHFWRRKSAQLLKTIALVESMWAPVEFQVCKAIVTKASKPVDDLIRKPRHGRRATITHDQIARMEHLTVDEHARALMIKGEDRRDFIERELRGRRYFMLPKLDVWRSEINQYKRDILEYRQRFAVAQALDTKLEEQVPIMPFQPTQVPSQPELEEMVVRARANHADSLDTHIAKGAPTAVVASAGVRKLEQRGKFYGSTAGIGW
mmetsp:Transcript_103348/g.236818  ORF Transcript_103348/g.236818 Transcript_103348/m.236818 type:complete len:617 (-) Transcript_103348:93-1943(-)